MNRIDRLTAMILMLQGRRVVTAEQMAEHFEVSVRTVYRDVTALGEAYSLEWLAGWLLGFGSCALVVEPEELRGMVREAATRVAGLYE